MRIFNHAQRMRIREMADAIRDGDDTEDRLICRGFTRAEITAYREAAVALLGPFTRRAA